MMLQFNPQAQQMASNFRFDVRDWQQRPFAPGAFSTTAKEPHNTIMHQLSEARHEEKRLLAARKALG